MYATTDKQEKSSNRGITNASKQSKNGLKQHLEFNDNSLNTIMQSRIIKYTKNPFLLNAIQKQGVNDKPKKISIEDLPEEQAKLYMISAYKKREFIPPEVDQKGNLLQLKPTKSSYDGGEMFVVSDKDLDTGTNTNSATREYVNDSKTFKPTFVQFNYLTSSSKPSSISNNLVYSVDNPQPSISYSSGSFYDAGHKLASQNGGLGDDNDWVFPQNPAFNQGNSRLLNTKEKQATGKTFPKWRAHEQFFHDEVKKNGYGVWWIEFQ